eukprot:7721270-Pyramimonas_sp.AAC.1
MPSVHGDKLWKLQQRGERQREPPCAQTAGQQTTAGEDGQQGERTHSGGRGGRRAEGRGPRGG